LSDSGFNDSYTNRKINITELSSCRTAITLPRIHTRGYVVMKAEYTKHSSIITITNAMIAAYVT